MPCSLFGVGAREGKRGRIGTYAGSVRRCMRSPSSSLDAGYLAIKLVDEFLEIRILKPRRLKCAI